MSGQVLSATELVTELDTEDVLESGVLKEYSVELRLDEFWQAIANSRFMFRHSSDGWYSVVREEQDALDFSKQSRSFDFHTDGLYYSKVPDFVILYCVDPGTTNTKTVFADSRMIQENLRNSDYWTALEQLEFVYVGKDAREFPRSLIEKHTRTGQPIFNLGTRGYIRPSLDPDRLAHSPSMRVMTRAANQMINAIDKFVVHAQEWQAGRLVFFDNQTYVHGRMAEEEDPTRVLYRFWLSMR